MNVLDVLTDVVLTVTGFQLMLLAGVVLVRWPGSDLRRNLLLVFLLAKTCMILRWFVVRFDLVQVAGWPGLYLASSALFFVLAPALFLYVRASCFRNFRLRALHLAHLIPCAGMIVFSVIGWLVSYRGFTIGNATLEAFIVDRFSTVFWCGNLVQIVFYIAAMYRELDRYRKRLHDVCSFADRVDMRWMRALLGLISLHWIFVTSRSCLALFSVNEPQLTAALDLFSISIFLVFTTALVVKGLAHVRHFPGIDEPVSPSGTAVGVDELEQCAERLVELMRCRRPHLDPSLSLEQLAAEIGVPPWQLSRTLNTVLGKNFFQFVNAHRIEEAKRRLADPTAGDLTMLRVLHDAGFNSKSTFNDAFKRDTGMTPSEFRRRHAKPMPTGNYQTGQV